MHVTNFTLLSEPKAGYPDKNIRVSPIGPVLTEKCLHKAKVLLAGPIRVLVGYISRMLHGFAYIECVC